MHLQQAVAAAIEEDDLSALTDLYSAFMQRGKTEGPPLGVNEEIVSVQGYPLNALAYAFRLGYTDIAQFLIEQAECDLDRMYALYKAAGKSPITILCEYGHLSLLDYFLPLHLDLIRSHHSCPEVSFQDQSQSLSLFQDDFHPNPPKKQAYKSFNTQSAIHRACEHGHMEVIKHVYAYLERNPPTPPDLDVHGEDEKTGENCALISARTGNLALMEFLLRICKANFRKLTKSRENAIQLAVFGAKYYKNKDYLSCLRFLVDQAGVDPLYEYEETLLLCEDPALQEYIEYKLLTLGIAITKAALEEKYDIFQGRSTHISSTLVELEARIATMGPSFQLKEVFRKELISSQPSSISPRSVTPFSMLSHLITP